MIRIESIIICNNLLIATTPTGRVKRTRDPKNYYIIIKESNLRRVLFLSSCKLI